MSRVIDTLERRLADDAGIYLAVEEDGATLVLSGVVASENQRQAALDIADAVAPGRRIQDNMAVEAVQPMTEGELSVSEAEVAGFAGAAPDTEEAESIEPGDFTDRSALTDPLAASGAGATGITPDRVSEGDEVYVPPIDPVGTNDQVIGGFETSTDALVASMATNPRGDEEIADNARLLLKADAATAELSLEIFVQNGVARLRGTVPTIDDGDLAAGVVSRVPGVREVVDELEVEGGRYL